MGELTSIYEAHRAGYITVDEVRERLRQLKESDDLLVKMRELRETVEQLQYAQLLDKALEEWR